MNGVLFFAAYLPATGQQLWKSDGTAEGTSMITSPQLLGMGIMTPLHTANGLVFFLTSQGLWRSNGTISGTMLLKPGNGHYFTAHESTLFFVAENIAQGQTTGYSLWKTDGSPAGTRSIHDFPIQAVPNELVMVDGVLFFVTDKSSTGMVLWRSDGTSIGTVPITTVCADTGAPYGVLSTNVNGLLFFTCGAVQSVIMSSGYELWKSDGTASGTKRIRSFNQADYRRGLFPLANVQGTLYFGANDGINGHEFWISGGTEAGTMLVQDIAPGSPHANPTEFTIAGMKVFFTADDGITGRALWAIPLTAIEAMLPTATVLASATPTPTSTALTNPIVSPTAIPTPFASSLQRVYLPALQR
jgi:ELWxxDGT repeat protein